MFLKLSIAIVALSFTTLVSAQNTESTNEKEHSVPAQDSSRSGKLFDELAKLDSELFDAAFVSCNQKKFEVFFTEDAEFYHDLAGVKFGADVRKLGPCPKDKGLTRILNKTSLQVFPVKEYGAIQTGDHSFVQNGSATVEVAHFIHLWRHTDKGWQISRVLSFGHEQQAEQSTSKNQVIAKKSTDPLFDTISTLDAAVFDAFNKCSSPEQLQKHADFFVPNIEFYHDTAGVTWSRQEMITNTEKYVCSHFRRELVPETLKVFPIKDFGAVEVGSHRFCQFASGKCEGIADFAIIWNNQNGNWLITRVLSYGHRPNE